MDEVQYKKLNRDAGDQESTNPMRRGEKETSTPCGVYANPIGKFTTGTSELYANPNPSKAGKSREQYATLRLSHLDSSKYMSLRKESEDEKGEETESHNHVTATKKWSKFVQVICFVLVAAVLFCTLLLVVLLTVLAVAVIVELKDVEAHLNASNSSVEIAQIQFYIRDMMDRIDELQHAVNRSCQACTNRCHLNTTYCRVYPSCSTCSRLCCY